MTVEQIGLLGLSLAILVVLGNFSEEVLKFVACEVSALLGKSSC